MERPDAAREAWSIVFELAMTNRTRLLAALERLGLTFMQAHVLRLLEPGEERSMSDLADTLRCDASNVTGIVDRLEARGLVERRSPQSDRRVKTLFITPAGQDIREHVRDAFSDPPDPIVRLSAADKRALRDILRRAVAG